MATTELGRHALIAGTGRCGTSLLVEVFSEIGLSTAIGREDDSYFSAVNAGHEISPAAQDLPYIIKSPFAYEWLSKKTSKHFLEKLDFAIIPVRSCSQSVSSRLVNEYINMYSDPRDIHPNYGDWQESPPISRGLAPGGLHFPLDPRDQARFLAVCNLELIYLLASHGVHTLFLPFPEYAINPDLACRLLQPFLAFHKITDNELINALNRNRISSKIHSYSDNVDLELAEIMATLSQAQDIESRHISLNEASHRALFRLYLNAIKKSSDQP
jgi:hypothetical protein